MSDVLAWDTMMSLFDNPTNILPVDFINPENVVAQISMEAYNPELFAQIEGYNSFIAVSWKHCPKKNTWSTTLRLFLFRNQSTAMLANFRISITSLIIWKMLRLRPTKLGNPLEWTRSYLWQPVKFGLRDRSTVFLRSSRENFLNCWCTCMGRKWLVINWCQLLIGRSIRNELIMHGKSPTEKHRYELKLEQRIFQDFFWQSVWNLELWRRDTHFPCCEVLLFGA